MMPCLRVSVSVCVYLFDKVSDTSSRKKVAKRFFLLWFSENVAIVSVCSNCAAAKVMSCVETLFTKTRSKSHHDFC